MIAKLKKTMTEMIPCSDHQKSTHSVGKNSKHKTKQKLTSIGYPIATIFEHTLLIFC